MKNIFNLGVTNQVLYLVYRRNLAIIRFIADNFQQYNFIILHIYLRNKETQQRLQVVVSIEFDASF